MDNCCDVESSEVDTNFELSATMQSLVAAYFGDGKVGGVVGNLYESQVSKTLKNCGYERFPIKKIAGAPTVTIGGHSPFTPLHADIKGEVDALVSGNREAFDALCKACPCNHIHPISSNNHILVCEAKVSSTEAINKMCDKGVVKSDYWIFENSGFHSVNVLFVNGGEASKKWVRYGGNSSKASAKAVWDELDRCKVSIFYLESFSYEWVTDTTKALERLNEELKDERETSKAEWEAANTAIERLNEELKDERETSKAEREAAKAAFADLMARIQKLEAGA